LKPFLPNKFRIYGWIVILFGIILGVTRFYFGIKLELLNIKVFAVYSKYFETNYFKIIENHVSEELTALLLLVGLFLISFTKEKIENDFVTPLRYKSLILTFYINTALVVLSFLFVYGFGFINVLVINVFSPFIIYIILFKYFLHKVTKTENKMMDTQKT
jgi:uncharacterized membrane protein SirB2